MNPNYKTQKTPKKIPLLRIIPLGGAGEVTKNMYVYEYGEHQLIIISYNIAIIPRTPNCY